MVYRWCMDGVWMVYGWCMDGVWIVYGQCMNKRYIKDSLMEVERSFVKQKWKVENGKTCDCLTKEAEKDA